MKRTIVTLTINAGLRVTGTMQTCILGNAYSATVRAFGGSGGGYVFIADPGQSLPSGLTGTDNNDGTYTVAGTTSVPGPVHVFGKLTDSDRNSVPYTFTFLVQPLPLTITGDCPDGTSGTAASFTYTIAGGLSPYTVTVTAGTAPFSGGFDNTGAGVGTRSNGSFSWTVHVVDSLGAPANISDSCTNTFSTLTLSGSAYPDAQLGVPYSAYRTISGGSGSYINARITAGSLPTGLSISIASSTHLLISGTPTALGTFSGITYAVDSTDSQTANGTQTIVTDTNFADDFVSLSNIVAVYGLKNYIRGYSGALFRVERLSDHTQLDINIKTGDVVFDSAQLATFGAGTDCRIVKYYHQISGGNYQLSLSYSSAPKIVSSGTVLSEAEYDGTTNYTYSNALVTFGTNKATAFIKGSVDNTVGSGSLYVILDLGTAVPENSVLLYDPRSGTNTPGFAAWVNNAGSYNIRTLGSLSGISSSSTITMLTDNTASATGQISLWLNGSSVTTSTGASVAPTGANFDHRIVTDFSYDGSTLDTGKGTLKGRIICAGDQTASRTSIEALL